MDSTDYDHCRRLREWMQEDLIAGWHMMDAAYIFAPDYQVLRFLDSVSRRLSADQSTSSDQRAFSNPIAIENGDQRTGNTGFQRLGQSLNDLRFQPLRKHVDGPAAGKTHFPGHVVSNPKVQEPRRPSIQDIF
jgi:hypothetical protein